MDTTYISTYPTYFAVASATVCLAFAVLLKRKSTSEDRSPGLNGPPMMPWLPIVGSLPFIPEYSKFHEFFAKKSQTMGPVIGFYIGKQYTVVVTGKEAMHDALVRKADMATRPVSFSKSKYFNPNYKGIGEMQYNECYQYHRKLTLNILKDFGFGTQLMETRIRYGVDQAVENIRKHQGAPLDPDEIVSSGTFSIMAGILFNKRFHQDDPDLKDIIRLEHLFFSEYYDFMAVDGLPSLLWLPRYQRLLEDNVKHNRELMQWIYREMINAVYHKENGESFVCSFLEREVKNGYDYEELSYIVRDLMLGGSGSSSAVVQWFIIYMANHPDILAKVQQEIDTVVGGSRAVSLEDEKNLPYTQATLLELLRRQSLAAFTAPHSASKSTRILDYYIPAGTMVLINLYGTHMDPSSWESPEAFLPERYLDSNGEVAGKEKNVAFSLGKRSCTGEHMARQEIFLFCASLAQHFHMLPPEGQEKISPRERIALLTTPEPFHARLVP